LPTCAVTLKVIHPAPVADPGMIVRPLTLRSDLYDLSAASAAVGLSVMFAAACTLPFCQAVRKAVPVCVASEPASEPLGEKPTVGTGLAVSPGMVTVLVTTSAAAIATTITPTIDVINSARLRLPRGCLGSS
jgi:hypothetical protein